MLCLCQFTGKISKKPINLNENKFTNNLNEMYTLLRNNGTIVLTNAICFLKS